VQYQPCYLSSCNHCEVSRGQWQSCQKTEEEQRRINLFIQNGKLVDKIDKELMKDKPSIKKVELMRAELHELIK